MYRYTAEKTAYGRRICRTPDSREKQTPTTAERV